MSFGRASAAAMIISSVILPDLARWAPIASPTPPQSFSISALPFWWNCEVILRYSRLEAGFPNQPRLKIVNSRVTAVYKKQECSICLLHSQSVLWSLGFALDLHTTALSCVITTQRIRWPPLPSRAAWITWEDVEVVGLAANDCPITYKLLQISSWGTHTQASRIRE